MNNDHQNNNNTRGRRFSHSFNIGTTIQNVFRNINHAFASNHDSGGQRDISRDPVDDMPPLEPLNSVGGGHDTRPTETTHPSTSSAAPDPSTSSADADMPPHSQLDSRLDDDEDSMPELRSVTESSDESDAGVASLDPVVPHQDVQPVDDDHDSIWSDDVPLEPATGTRRARVDDDGDDARDRRHPSERVGGPPPPGDAAPQSANPQLPPRPPPGLFGALFGLGPPGGNHPGGDAPPEHTHTHTGEGTADPSPADNNPTPGHAPRDAPILTAGFTLTIPLFGPPPGNRTGPAAGGQGGAPGMMGMDAAAREELFASFAAFFQEFQALDEGREDPERAKKLVAGLEVVPLGLVKRLERVGDAPGGHVGDPNSEGSSTGCAICWDTLLDAESDSFGGQQFSGGEVPQSEMQSETHAENDAMDVDASASHSEPGTSAPPSSEPVTIISLPCAHVFHASCLLPWFTRAKQATCPTCRFNIDPENLTYSLPRRAFNRAPPAQPDNAVPNAVPVDPQAAPQVPLEAGTHAVDAAAPQVDPTRATTDAHPAAGAVPSGRAFPLPTGQAGVPPAGLGFNPFVNIPGIPVFSFPAIQIPLRPTAGQAPGDGNQGMDVMTIGFDMFVGVPPPQEERGGDPRDNAEGGDAADNGEAGAGAAGGNGAANPNGLAQDLHSLIEGLLRTTRNIIPQVINPQGPAPADAPPAADGQPQPQVRPVPEGAGRPVPPPGGGPRFVPFPPNMFRPTRPMPPRRERKTWTVPPAPGPSLRQRVEQREREKGLRCSDTSCGVGPSDEDPYPEALASLTKQVYIHPLGNSDDSNNDGHVCAHAFHPECLVSAERVAGWGGQDKTEPLVEVSCPVCRAVGCVTRDEWELGVSAL